MNNVVEALKIMTGTVCARCSTPGTVDRDGKPWCAACEMWLKLDDVTGEWVSFAEALWRTQQRAYRLQEAEALTAAQAELPLVVSTLPAGWTAQIERAAIVVDTPDAAKVTAYLRFWTDHWTVRIVNWDTGIGACIFAAGGTRAASYDDCAEALAAAVDRLQIETRSR